MSKSIQMPAETVLKWQEIVDLLAQIMQVPAALIMRVEPPNITVFVSSEFNGNPYAPAHSASLNTGLYCDTVVKSRQFLLVPDALADEAWRTNPDIELGMVSYLGVPISWPDGEIFGTICVLDNKRNDYSQLFIRLLLQFRDVLQADLQAITTLNKLLEDETHESERRYRGLEAALAHANRVTTLGHLMATISHEIKQPLAACVTNAAGGLRWLSAQPPNLDEARQAFERVTQAAQRASEITNRILRLVKNGPPDVEWVRIDDAICEIIVLTRAEAERGRVTVRKEFADDLPLVQCDRVQLQQVILNLIVNAIEAMSVVRGRRRELTIATSKADSGAVLVSVRDSGPGVAPQICERLFEPFSTTKEHGIGMGLSISRSIVQAHGGELTLAANKPRGAVFQFTIPTIMRSTLRSEAGM
jgi:signal transduction histidine kinase